MEIPIITTSQFNVIYFILIFSMLFIFWANYFNANKEIAVHKSASFLEKTRSPCLTDFLWHILAPGNPCPTPGSRYNPGEHPGTHSKYRQPHKCLLIYTQQECEIDLYPLSIHLPKLNRFAALQ